MNRLTPRFGLCLLVLLSLSLWPLDFAEAAPKKKKKSQKPQEIRVLAFDLEPFFYRDASGKPQGLEYDLIRSFAEESGYRLRILWTTQFSDLLVRLEAGAGDLAGGALTNTEERRTKFDFSIAHFPALSLLIERKGEESESVKDLFGKRVAARHNSSNEQILMNLGGVEIVHAPTIDELLNLVVDGEVQGAVTDSGPYLWLAEQYPELTTVLRMSERSFYGFAMMKDSPFKAELDAHLRKLRDSGRYEAFLHDAFGKWGAEAVNSMSAGMFED